MKVLSMRGIRLMALTLAFLCAGAVFVRRAHAEESAFDKCKFGPIYNEDWETGDHETTIGFKYALP